MGSYGGAMGPLWDATGGVCSGYAMLGGSLGTYGKLWRRDGNAKGVYVATMGGYAELCGSYSQLMGSDGVLLESIGVAVCDATAKLWGSCGELWEAIAARSESYAELCVSYAQAMGSYGEAMGKLCGHVKVTGELREAMVTRWGDHEKL